MTIIHLHLECTLAYPFEGFKPFSTAVLFELKPQLNIILVRLEITLSPYLSVTFNNRSDLQIRVCIEKLFSLFLIQTICCGTQKNRLNETVLFEHPKHMFKLMGKKIV